MDGMFVLNCIVLGYFMCREKNPLCIRLSLCTELELRNIHMTNLYSLL